MNQQLPGSLAARVRMALDSGEKTDSLRALAADPQIEVRTAVAMNRSLPPDAVKALAVDGDARVRAVLGARLATLCPDLAADEQDDARAHVMAMLRSLVQDEAERVRGAIAQALQTMPGSPRELILQLAHDKSLKIADPVIRLSPVLTTDDLISLLTNKPDRASSIAARPMLDARVCEAIVAQANEEAVRVLLENPGAALHEATLDRLIARAVPHACWHGPLVRRPVLTACAAQALASFVADELLKQLAARSDLGRETIVALQDHLRRRAETATAPAETAPFWPEEDPNAAASRLFAQKLREGGALDETAILHALRRGQRRLAIALLAAAADLPPPCVQRAVNLRSTKALVSLAWKAGLSARIAVPVQTVLGQIAPGAALIPTPDGGFPISIEEMRWQITFLTGKAKPEMVG
jgi:uncharacterized protein (DUF2336 family)